MREFYATRGRLCLLSATCLIAAAPDQVFAQAQPLETGVADIVITAQRREERLVDVPITVTSVSGDALAQAGISSSSQLSQLVPAFRLDYNGGFAQPTIRGVSTALANVGGGSSVAVYVDGFYNASPLTNDFELLNVSSIQVLKGPQGTLFGRNATAGAVLVTTSEPSEETAVQIRAEYSRFDSVNLAAYATTGIAPGLSVDVAGLYKRSDGWLTNLTDGNDEIAEGYTKNVRVGVKWEFGDSNYLLFRYNHAKRKDPTVVNGSVYQEADGRFQSAAYAFGLPGVVFGTDNRNVATDPGFIPYFGSTTDTFQLTGSFDLGFATLTSYSQYRKEKARHDIEVDYSSAPLFRVFFDNEDELKTQEFLLNSKPGGRLDWVAGIFYLDQKAGQRPFGVVTPPLGGLYNTHIHIKSIGVFADATYEVLDNLFLTVGGRYGHDKDTGYWDCFPTGLAAGFCPAGQNLEDSFSNFSPRGVIRYQLGPESSIYASITRGFKAGLLDVNGFRDESIEPETITSYEAGYKMASGGTQLQLSGFYYDYKKLQVSIYTGTASITTNAATSEIYGAEASLSQVLDRLRLSAGVAWTHGRYTDYPGAPGNVFDYTAGVIDNSPVDASGNHMIRSPSWTGNISADYSIDLGGGSLVLNANAYFTSKFYFDAANNHEQGSYALINARATWTDANDRFSIGIFGNNLTDEAYRTQVLPNGPGVGVGWGAPLTYGVTAGVKF